MASTLYHSEGSTGSYLHLSPVALLISQTHFACSLPGSPPCNEPHFRHAMPFAMTVKHNLETRSRREVSSASCYFYSPRHFFSLLPRHSRILSLSFPFCFKLPPPTPSATCHSFRMGVLLAAKALRLPPTETSGWPLPEGHCTGYRV